MEKLVIGTYTDKEGKGIYTCSCQKEEAPILAAEIENPSYLLYSADLKKLYAVSEHGTEKVKSFDIVDNMIVTGQSLYTETEGLVHIVMDSKCRYLFTASYNDACVQMIQLSKTGDPEKLVCCVQHKGSSKNPLRQEKAHAHSVWLTPDEKELCVCDLGCDILVVYAIDYEKGLINEEKEKTVKFPAGAGPRHLTFNPEGNQAYVLTELSSQIYSYFWSAKTGFKLVQVLDLLDEPDSAVTAAAIRISDDGHYLYASCRGNDIIAVLSIADNGLLRMIQTVSTEGRHPRDIKLSPDNDFLLCANKDSDSISVFSRDKQSGLLYYKRKIGPIPNPIALEFI